MLVSRRIARTSLVLGVSLACGACDNRPDQWDAFIYPDRDNLSLHYQIRGFKTFEHCQEAAQSDLDRRGWAEAGDYECGYKCGPHEGFSGMLCEETRK